MCYYGEPCHKVIPQLKISGFSIQYFEISNYSVKSEIFPKYYL